MRPLLICCLLLWATPVSAAEPPPRDICASLAQRLDAAAGGTGTKEHQLHTHFFLWKCIAQACLRTGVDPAPVIRGSKTFQVALARVRAKCVSPSL